MIENNFLDSSQESLPLSQETASALFKMLESPANDMLLGPNVQDWGNIPLPADEVPMPTVECLGKMSDFISQHQAPQQMAPEGGSLPAVSNWPGKYSFKVFFESQDPLPKKAPWAFSEVNNKLYTKRDSPCPINVSTNEPMSKGVFIRVTAVFSEPKHMKEVVTRCINHSIEDLNKNFQEAEHLVRCESALSYYTVDYFSKRHSVCVPFENSPVGQEFSAYLYKFMCYSSCSGGPNRRQTTIVFTLEDGNNVLGRQSFGLKVCACPIRDKISDEKPKVSVASAVPVQDLQLSSPCPKKAKLTNGNSQAVISQVDKIMDIKTSDVEPRRKKNLTVKASDEGMYKFLIEMRKYYCMHQTAMRLRASNHPSASALHSVLYLVRSSSDEEADKP